jgi:hypothetical protein
VVGWLATAGVTDCGISSGQRIGEQVLSGFGVPAAARRGRGGGDDLRIGVDRGVALVAVKAAGRGLVPVPGISIDCEDDRSGRKTNRRHMTGDHHGQTARSATLLVTAADEIVE